ncbi:hypothetical protein JTB14_035486 [Gonioctena quinquepunctata]|nr:hypothetical protein JTB14_035486 [Gonioctena quinquepunctata]
MEEYKQTVDNIMERVRGRKRSCIIAGDANAASPLWGAKTTNTKGVHWTDWVATLDLVTLNRGDTRTFTRNNNTRSETEVTNSTEHNAAEQKRWIKTVSRRHNLLLTEPSYTLKKLTEKIRTAQEISSIRKANSSADQPYWLNENIARVWKRRRKTTNDNQENNMVAEC